MSRTLPSWMTLGLAPAAIVALLALTMAAPQAAHAQQTVEVSGIEALLVVDDSDGVVPSTTDDVDVDVVLRFTVDTEIEASAITAVSAGDVRVRATGAIELSTGTGEPGPTTCAKTANDDLVWTCVVSSHNAYVAGISGQQTLSLDAGATYSLTVTGANNGAALTGSLEAATLVITLGGQVVEVASVTLDLVEGETAARMVGGDGIDLVLSILNANDAAADAAAISSIFVTAPPLTLTSSAPGSSCAGSVCQWSVNGVRLLGGRGAGAIAITANSSTAAGPVAVTARVIDAAGEERQAESDALTFAGAASSLTLGAPSGALLNEAIAGTRDEIKIELTAADASGHATQAPSRLTLAVSDPSGRTVSRTAMSRERLDADANGRVYIELKTLAASSSPLTAGEYTLRVSGGSAVAVERAFQVAGKAAAVELRVDPPAWSSDNVGRLTVVAEVSDATGLQVADGTPVRFTTQGLGAQLIAQGSSSKTTSGGRVSIEFLVVTPGRAVVTATADEQQGTEVVTIAAPTGGAGQGGPEPVSLAGLTTTELGAAAVWLESTSTSASVLYDLLKPRGVSVLWTWDNDTRRWIGYGESRDGLAAPGAVDFSVNRGVTLWLIG